VDRCGTVAVPGFTIIYFFNLAAPIPEKPE
jgi:hypothetical protein